jgi:hypothetical protein
MEVAGVVKPGVVVLGIGDPAVGEVALPRHVVDDRVHVHLDAGFAAGGHH